MNLSINKLKESNDFLNSLFENITSAIFLVDKNVRIQEFNNSFKVLFNKRDTDILNGLCGNVIGCIYAFEEGEDCGNTSNCGKCCVRSSIIKAFEEKENTLKKVMNRKFYIKDTSIQKHLQFTIKHMTYNDEDMVLVILDDVTDIENSKLELQRNNKIIQNYNDKIKKELSIARNVQQSLIPDKTPIYNGVRLTAVYKPLYEVGGDLYDFINIDEDNVGIFISDISGHGIAAAMITTMVKAILETSKDLLYTPDKLMENINSKILNVAENMYLTAFYGIYNNKTKEFTYIRCSHPYPLLIRDNKCIEIKESEGMMLGVFDGLKFKSHKIKLKEGDKILFYTDGLVEAKNNSGCEFNDKAYEIVNSRLDKNINEIIDDVNEELILFKENQEYEDDICMLGMQI
ncbi:MAG: PP2C family protein-serine/threonine phosphatase [Tepidibacter sp.]|uniref:PP2C family protein-serine/threonine phosphatase n=1 Tax=Tepidibacter sp. TaxID=2529387 RepID=UPI0025EE8E66|nr:PP2C family protein-serine/threonine phosphatase [Tepidibacter sp.]MCT4507463.1 PP2C family protein-serine/threonine phosphatase [Tepidibacter sp.]